MMQDILTVMWKERKHVIHYRGSRTHLALVILSPLLLAIYLPWEAGLAWVNRSAPSLLISALVPMILIMLTIPDSFAGERERHTLSTLLASRLPDRAILFGKIVVSVAFACVVTWIVLLASLITVNVVHGQGQLLVYKPLVALIDIAFSFLLASLMASAGVLVSMRSATVQEASTTLVAIFMAPPSILGLVFFVLVSSSPDALRQLDPNLILLLIFVGLALANIVLWAVAMARFKRARLILG